MRIKTAPVSAVVDPALKKKFVRLTRKNKLTISQAIGHLMEWAEKNQEIPR